MLMILAILLVAGTRQARDYSRPFRLFFLPHLLGHLHTPGLALGNHLAHILHPGVDQLFTPQAHIRPHLFTLEQSNRQFTHVGDFRPMGHLPTRH
jgi:hypothetical protein